MTDRSIELLLAAAAECGGLALRDLFVELEHLAGDREFTVSELIAHARSPDHVRLRNAIAAAVGELNPIKLGQYLARWQDSDIAGITITALGREAGAVVWGVHSKPGRTAAADTGIVTALPLARKTR